MDLRHGGAGAQRSFGVIANDRYTHDIRLGSRGTLAGRLRCDFLTFFGGAALLNT